MSMLKCYYCFNRYKERLQTKFIKSLKPTDTSKHLVGKNWLFVKDGLDDFRDGYPPPVEGDIILKVNLALNNYPPPVDRHGVIVISNRNQL